MSLSERSTVRWFAKGERYDSENDTALLSSQQRQSGKCRLGRSATLNARLTFQKVDCSNMMISPNTRMMFEQHQNRLTRTVHKSINRRHSDCMPSGAHRQLTRRVDLVALLQGRLRLLKADKWIDKLIQIV